MQKRIWFAKPMCKNIRSLVVIWKNKQWFRWQGKYGSFLMYVQLLKDMVEASALISTEWIM